jgi:hypothetical protein
MLCIKVAAGVKKLLAWVISPKKKKKGAVPPSAGRAQIVLDIIGKKNQLVLRSPFP